MQDHIHELAKTLPPPRKQNIACDPCRQRKVKCHQIPGEPKCQHCTAKNYNCTHHAQQATTEKKRLNTSSRRPRALSSNNAQKLPQTNGGQSKDAISAQTQHTETLYSGQPAPPQPSPPAPAPAQTPTPVPAPVPVSTSVQTFRPPLSFGPPVRRDSSFSEILGYLFSQPDSANPQFPWQEWGDLAHMLEEESYRLEFAHDLIEVYFQIVHARLPFLNPSQFRERLQPTPATPSLPNPPPFATAPSSFSSSASQYASTSSAPFPTGVYASTGSAFNTPPGSAYGTPSPPSHESPHPALVATVIAWGAKFSEHPLLVADRNASGGKTSRLAVVLVDRARELAEAFKVHRTPRPEHVVIGLMIESLQSQRIDDATATGWRGFWLSSAIRQLFQLNINHKSVVSGIADQDERGTMIFAWWFSCLADAYASAYYRRKPQIDDEDYNVDFYTAEPLPETRNDKTDPREHLEFLGYYRAAHALARIARYMSRTLWTPSTDAEGLPLETLQDIMHRLQDWRSTYLAQVGVPSNFAAEWDFVSAVSACASDATFHVMWIILFNALDDFGVRELNILQRMGPQDSPEAYQARTQSEELMRKLLDEGLHGALRIAGLAGVLTKNGYLRLDPAIMHVSCQQAGMLLARFARPEVENCVAGLDQYAFSYEEAGEQARALERAYTAAVGGEVEFTHMATIIARAHAEHQQQQMQNSPVHMQPTTAHLNHQSAAHMSQPSLAPPTIQTSLQPHLHPLDTLQSPGHLHSPTTLHSPSSALHSPVSALHSPTTPLQMHAPPPAQLQLQAVQQAALHPQMHSPVGVGPDGMYVSGRPF